MNIQQQIENTKVLISKNKLKKALATLKAIYSKSDLQQKEQINFEIGKVYMLLKKHLESVYYLRKLRGEKFVKMSYDLLFQNYAKIKRYKELLKIYDNFNKDQIKLYIVSPALNACLILKDFKKALSIIHDIKKNNISDLYLDETMKILYSEISHYIQILNVKNKFNKVQQFFKAIYEHIPDSEKKLKNIILNEYELSQGKLVLKSYPRIIQIVLTTICNLHCIMCAKKNHDSGFIFPDKDLKDLIGIMPYLQKLILRGGEVFFDKRIYQILDEANKNNVKIEIITNGLLLNEKLINKLIDNNTDIVFSIDSPVKHTYESIRVGAKFENLLKILHLVNKIKKRRNSRIAFSINMVVMKRNYHEIADMIKFASKYKFDGLTIAPVESDTGGDESIFDYKVDYGIVKKLSKKRKEFHVLSKRYNVVLINKLPSSYKFKKNMPCDYLNISYTGHYNNYIKNDISIKKHVGLFCHTPWREMFLDEEHSIRPNCLCHISSELKTIKNRNGILSVWNGKLMQEYRKNIFSKKINYICAKKCLQNKIVGFDKKRIV
jgi:MoaA/NifB/PqqE/SkfB family radical SAM enzyme